MFYRLHPDPDKVDKHCGAFDRSYVVEPVRIPEGEGDVLRRALEALFREEWDLPNVVGPVTITDGRAIVNLGSWEGLGFAGTSCGSVGFLGSVLRTAFQFDSIQEVRILVRGSCKRFGRLIQAERCLTFDRDDFFRKDTD